MGGRMDMDGGGGASVVDCAGATRGTGGWTFCNGLCNNIVD